MRPPESKAPFWDVEASTGKTPNEAIKPLETMEVTTKKSPEQVAKNPSFNSDRHDTVESLKVSGGNLNEDGPISSL